MFINLAISILLICPRPAIMMVFYDNANPAVQEYLTTEISAFYGIKIVKDIQSMPKMAYYPPRNRYRADSILSYQRNQDVIGFTSKDISCTKGKLVDHGIFGLAVMNHNNGIVSSYRLKGDREKYLTVCLHEMGHMFGVPHCSNTNCLMTAGNGGMVKSTRYMCTSCRHQIWPFLAFKPVW
jgi:archaemetzincin